jgi:hypothetical protein
VHERQRPVDQADEEDGVPLEALGGVQDASVTPSTLGACWADARSSSSATSSRRPAPGTSSRGRRRAGGAPASDSQRSRVAPAPAGGLSGSQDRPGAQDVGRQRGEAVGRVGVGDADGAAQQQQGLADLLAVEEALAARTR